MGDDSMAEISFLINLFVVVFIILLILLLLINLSLFIVRRRVRHQVSSTDLDLIGLKATVTKTIHSQRPGRISCRTEAGDLKDFEAISNRTIRSGRQVLITSAEKECFRVLPVELANQAGSLEQNPKQKPE